MDARAGNETLVELFAGRSQLLVYHFMFDPGYHTYSCYARGLDAMNGAYQWLDLTPKGRDKKGLKSTMAWLRHHDKY